MIAEEYQIESAFIYQFTNFIEWPEDAQIVNKNGKFLISVYGSPQLVTELQASSNGKTIKGYPIEIRLFMKAEELMPSQIVYVKDPGADAFLQILKKIKGKGTLLISHAKGLGEKGSMINFFADEGRIKFEINRTSIETEQFQVNSRLLKLARLIN
jgi:hypothetical protein